MTRLEKLTAIRDAYNRLIPCVANNAVQELDLVLSKAPEYLNELIAAETPAPGEHRAVVTIKAHTDKPNEITAEADYNPAPPVNVGDEVEYDDYPAVWLTGVIIDTIATIAETAKEQSCQSK